MTVCDTPDSGNTMRTKNTKFSRFIIITPNSYLLYSLYGIFGILPFELRNSLYILVFDYFSYNPHLIHCPCIELSIPIKINNRDSRSNKGGVRRF